MPREISSGLAVSVFPTGLLGAGFYGAGETNRTPDLLITNRKKALLHIKGLHAFPF